MKSSTRPNIYTDLALENCEQLHSESDDALNGIEITTEEESQQGITVTWVKITNEAGAQSMGKPVGNYITLESAAMKESDPPAHEEISKILARKLGELFPLPPNATILVVGLGNWQVTPDALGPQVCEKMLVTRHLQEIMPHELQGRVRSVSALRPGVMGITGIETAEIILGVTRRITPDLIIAIDALAARKTARVNTTIQISDTGINPGAGLGNKRTPINRESVGIPVIAIGVPTVVDAATLVNDTMDNLLHALKNAASQSDVFFDMLDNMAGDERYALIKEILDPEAGNMFVTPKEVDAVITRLAHIIASALNMALHPGITPEDVNRYLN
ncbi:MAG: GPR endopeptidase [Defluviitaleaceae bacterium]|nr:GPR endopeptidase [Defluviitaleaceae bacterium]MCL2238717.1 GPR endopeptidase [Defluviitaleaceae bacterium]